MSNSRRTDIIFLIVSGLAVFLLVYIAMHLIERISENKEIIKLAITVILPVPYALYANFIAASVTKGDKTINKKDIIIGVIIFFISIKSIFLLMKS